MAENTSQSGPDYQTQLQTALDELKNDFLQKVGQLEETIKSSATDQQNTEESEFSAGYIAFAGSQEERTFEEVEEIVNKIAADYSVGISKLNMKWGAYELTFTERIYSSILVSFVYALSSNHLYVVRLF